MGRIIGEHIKRFLRIFVWVGECRKLKALPGKNFVEEAKKWLGDKSVLYDGLQKGCAAEDGFDCSGFVTYFDFFGVVVHEQCIGVGDLVFFSRNGIRPTHMGIMICEK